MAYLTVKADGSREFHLGRPPGDAPKLVKAPISAADAKKLAPKLVKSTGACCTGKSPQ